MVAVWKITSDEPYQKLIIHPKNCIDLSGHCPWWKGQGECKKNPLFMEEVRDSVVHVAWKDCVVFLLVTNVFRFRYVL